MLARMSYDFGAWKAALDPTEPPYQTYLRLCDGDGPATHHSPDVVAFRAAILSSLPDWVDVIEPDDGDEAADRYVILSPPLGWLTEPTGTLIESTAAAHGLVLFDPQKYEGPTEDDF